jgi:uncharacterized membrane-anchored protein YhcB (DUF1043 family)
LKRWDSLMFMNPASVMDSLQNFKPEKLSESNFAYFTLLSTIGSCMNDIDITDDSTITKTVEWYRSKSDYFNLCRSLIFCSAANFNKQIFLNDSIKHINLTEAEDLFARNKVKDPVTEAFLNKYLAKKSIHLFYSNRSDLLPSTLKAEEYIKRAETLFMKLGNKREMQLTNLYLSEIVIGVYEYDKELEILNKIAGFPDLEQDIRPLLNKKFAHLFQKKGEYDKSIHYLKSVIRDSLFGISSKIKKSDIVNDIAVIYDIKNQPDSAIKYAILYKDLMLKDLQKSHIGYQFLSKIYEKNGDYTKALDLYKKYSNYTAKLYTIELKNRTLQNKSENNLLINKIRQKESLSKSIIFALISSLVGLIVTILYLKSGQRKDNTKLDRELDELKKHIDSQEKSLKKMWITNEVLKTTAGKYPDLIRDVHREAAKCRREAKGTYDNLNTIIDDSRQISREMISEIAKNKSFAKNFPEIFNKVELSHYEKIIYALFSLGYDAKEIANFFSVSPSTIRAVKTRLKDKHE